MIHSAAQNVLVLAPHPDDESLGCGGTIRQLSAGGVHVDVLFLTRGQRGVEAGAPASREAERDLARRRTLEAEEACQVLGVRQTAFLEGRDGRLCTQPELAADILRALEADDYQSVFCPWPGDAHSDHVATYRLLYHALTRYPRQITVWLYEVWSPQLPNLVLPIDATLADKLAAISLYRSQTALFDYVGVFRSLARYRSMLCPTANYAEAFFTCDRVSLLEDRDLPWLRPTEPALPAKEAQWQSCG